MDILRAFKITDSEIHINIQGTHDDPLFQANQIAQVIGLSNIRETLRDFDIDEKITMLADTPGGRQNVTFLTEMGLYKLLGISRKPIARTFQKWVHKVIKELRQRGVYELKQHIEAERILIDHRVAIGRHKALISSHINKRVLYFTKLKDVNDTQFILKLGFTNDIENRNRSLNTQFGGCVFLDIFECYKNQEFELFLKRHPDIIRFAFKDEIIPNSKSTETYLVTKEDYTNIISKIVKKNIDQYQGLNPDQVVESKRLDVEQQRIELENRKLSLKEDIINNVQQGTITLDVIDTIAKIIDQYLPNNIINTDNSSPPLCDEQEVPPEIYIDERKKYSKTNTQHRNVQQYDGATRRLLKTYTGIMDVVRRNPSYSVFGIKNAANNNTIYHGYRWFFIDNNMEHKEYEIPETKITQATSISRQIALLNKEKTRIEKVFQSQRQAANAIGLKRVQTLNDAIHANRALKNDIYFMFFDDVNEELKQEYLQRSTIESTSSRNGTKVLQLDPLTKQVIKSYDSIADVLKVFYMTRATLKRATESGEIHQGFFWKMKDDCFDENDNTKIEDVDDVNEKIEKNVQIDTSEQDTNHDIGETIENQVTNNEETSIVTKQDYTAKTDKKYKYNSCTKTIYKYNKDDLKTPIATFTSIRDALRSLNNPKILPHQFNHVCVSNTILEDARWYCVEGDEQLPETIPPTEQVQEIKPKYRKGLIAQLNREKTKIINVFPSQNDAAKTLKVASCSITSGISKQRPSAGFYWMMYDDCSEQLKSTFTDELPASAPASPSSKIVERLNPETNEVIEKYACIQDICLKYKTSHKTINKVCGSGDIFKGFKWRFAQDTE